MLPREGKRSASEKRTASGEAELERNVLGGLLLAPDALGRVTDRLFDQPAHKKILRAMNDAHPLNVVTLADALRRRGELELAGGLAYLGRLMDQPTAAYLETHVSKLRDAAARRAIVGGAERILSRAAELSADELVDLARNAFGVWEEQRALPSTLREAFLRARTGTSAMLRTKPKPREWLIDRLILDRKVGTVVAPGGTGKGHFAMQVAISVGSGEMLGPFQVPRARGVLWLSREDDTDEQQRRLQDAIAARWLCKADPERDARIERNLRFVDLVEEPDARIDNAEFLQLVLDEGALVPDLGLVILDPLSLIIPDRPDFDLNSVKGAKEIHAFAKRITAALGCAVMLVHHTNKGAARGGTELDANASAGSKQIVDLARWNINAKALSRDDATKLGLERRHNYLEIEPPKNNYAARLSERCVWRQQSNTGALIHTPVETVSAADCARLLNLLGELGTATSAEWEAAAGKLEPPISRRSFEPARDAMLREQRIEVAPHEGPKKRGQQPIRYRISEQLNT